MRPVEKKRPGELICYTDSNNQKVEHRIKEHYPDYGDAKFPLSANIGAHEMDSLAIMSFRASSFTLNISLFFAIVFIREK